MRFVHTKNETLCDSKFVVRQLGVAQKIFNTLRTENMTDYLQLTLSNAFSWKNIIVFWLNSPEFCSYGHCLQQVNIGSGHEWPGAKHATNIG